MSGPPPLESVSPKSLAEGAIAPPAVVIDPEREAKLQKIENERLEGNEKLKAKDYLGALRIYHSVLLKAKGFPNASPPIEPTAEQIAALEKEGKTVPLAARHITALTYLNSAVCHIHLERWNRAEDCARDALKTEEKNVKAKYRLGEALIGKGPAGRSNVYEEMNKENPGDAAVNQKVEWLRTQSSQAKANVGTGSKLKGAFAKQDNGQTKADVKGKGKAEGEGAGFEYPELGANAEKKAEEAEAKEVQAEAGANPAVAVGEAKAAAE